MITSGPPRRPFTPRRVGDSGGPCRCAAVSASLGPLHRRLGRRGTCLMPTFKRCQAGAGSHRLTRSADVMDSDVAVGLRQL